MQVTKTGIKHTRTRDKTFWVVLDREEIRLIQYNKYFPHNQNDTHDNNFIPILPRPPNKKNKNNTLPQKQKPEITPKASNNQRS